MNQPVSSQALSRNQSHHWMDEETLEVVRPEVRKLLQASNAFNKLPPEEQKQIAQTMVKVASYMANPDGLAPEAFKSVGNGVLARAQEDEKDAKTMTGQRASSDPGFAGDDFKAGAVNAGVQAFGAMVKKVDFPKFVSGLIQGVFQAIVESSIEQMRAYGELIANVSKSVTDFANDNISENNARDWLQERFPGTFGVEQEGMSGGFAEDGTPQVATSRLALDENAPEGAMVNVNDTLRFPADQRITDISDPESEKKLVLAAQLEIARGRQQLLASMVMLGINRIVITDGLIHAKVVFDMKASDTAKRGSRAAFSDADRLATQTKASTSYGGWFSPVKAGFSSQVESEHVTTVESSLDENSESKADVKAKLTGEVRVNFKSDYMPMEKLASAQTIAAIQGRAVPPDNPVSGK
jgi:hypothetical protein